MAQRVNKRFLIILTIVVAAFAALLAITRLLVHRTPTNFVTAGDAAATAGRWDEAAGDYNRALSLGRGTPELFIHLGEALEHRVAANPTSLGAAQSAYENAAAVDPHDPTPLQHLLAIDVQLLQLQPNPRIFDKLHEVTAKLVALDPTDARAAAYQQVAVILQNELGGSASDYSVNQNLETLAQLIRKDPSDADLPYYYGHGKLYLASEALRLNDKEKAAAFARDAASLFDAALSAQGDDAALNWRAASLYASLPGFDPANAAADLQKSDNALARARSLAKPQDPHFADIAVSASISALRHKHPDEAERILRDLLAALPNSPEAELELGGFLGRVPAKRDEAIAVLSTPITGADAVGVAALRIHGFEANRLFHVTRLRIDSYLGSSDAAHRKELLAKIDDGYQSLSGMTNEDSASLLQLKAEIQQLKGSPIEAMATFSRALAVMAHSGEDDPDLMFHAAMLDFQEGQTGDAEGLLLKVAAETPDNVACRLALAELYLQQNSPEKAQPHLDVAEKISPDSAQLLLLRIKQLAAQKQIDAAQSYYARLPEVTRASQLAKASAAVLLGNNTDAARLLEALRVQSPDDVSIVGPLAQVYARSDQKDRAAAVVEQALLKNPTDVRLLILRNQLERTTPGGPDVIDPQVLAATDAFTRELLGFESESARGNYDAAAAHLAAADKLKPDNKRVHDLYFQLDLAQHRFDLAAKEIPTLARLQADDADGLVYQVHLAMAEGDEASAVKYSRDLVGRRPQFSVSYSLLGQSLAASGHPEEAVAEFNNALSRKQNNFDALAGLIKAYLQLNQIDQAEKAIATARGLFPGSVTFREMALDDELNHSDHPENVVKERAAILEANPNDVANYVGLATAALRVGEIRLQSDPESSRQFVDQARDVLQKAFARWPHDVPVVGFLAQIAQYRGDPVAAEKLLTDLAAAPELASKPQPSQLLYNFYAQTGKPDLALQALRDAFEKSGHSVEVEQQLGSALAQSRKFDEALTLLAAANADDPRIVRQRISTLIAAGRMDDAVSQIKTALAASPGSIDLLNLLTSAYIAAGRFADGRQPARDALAADPKNGEALYHQALIEMQLPDGDIDMALRDATALKDEYRASTAGYELLADIYYRRNQPSDAIRTLEDGLKAAPLDRASRLRLLQAYAGASPPLWSLFDGVVAEAENLPQLRTDPIWLVKDAYGLSARQQFDAAVAKIDQAIQLAPNDQTLPPEKLSILMNAKNYPAVIATADQLLAGNGKLWWAYMARGDAKAQTDKAGGLVDLDAALMAAPDFVSSARVIEMIGRVVGSDEALNRAKPRDADPSWRLLTARIYMNKGDFATAAAEAGPLRQQGDLTKEQRVAALGILAESYRTLHQPQDARDAYLDLLALAPNDAGMLNNLANVLADDLHEPTQAVAYSQRAYDLSRQTGAYVASVSDTHGWVLTLCGGRDAQLGLSILQKVVEDHQDFVDARYHLGEAYLRESMPGDAIKQLQIALDQVQQAEQSRATPDPALKSAIENALAKARQERDGKADIGDKE
jgi:predicted Zn-dependent protease